MVTVDTTMLGWRETDLKHIYLPFLLGEGIANFLSDPAFLSRLKNSPSDDPAAAIQEFLSVYVNPAFTWEDLASIRNMTKLPILVKGITHPDDAKRVQDMDLHGVIVSNHGGRQVDGGIAALDALVEIRQAVGPAYLLLMDSGIRSAADICKALALGAHAVLLGRPYAYALAAGGREGVAELLMQYRAGLDLQLALSGYKAIRDLGAGYVSRRA
ncbi:alpha-hydroxy-acid oxidizing protein [Alicyclobacillus dauci]|uniref:Alpha-hydroxy-acid oxidizing protein n=1 Tax=Alicyclobacillus dauci TaxID=1475485 RepID=A0ABY6Z8Q5_9BACL|nr:alpha-hydroxy-acid oxidizing protein [Alicyclobacillus dauci]WAH39267.1 alpha-hydroxy-acid oxidizing protein [Alicyclobacillus dauci]